ncbi:MAG TPA: hypothetical protein VGD56_13265 [Gemmatirosa sp.]
MASRLAGLTASPEPTVQSPGGFQQAAAVLAQYDPATLRPVTRAGTPPDTLGDVLDKSTVVYEPDGSPVLTLRTDARQQVLASFGTQEALTDALRANPERASTPLQAMLDAYIVGSAPPLESQSKAELSATLQVIEWFGDGAAVPVPPVREVRRLLERETLLDRFRELAGLGFVGRRDELSRLRKHVEFLQAEELSEAVGRGLRRALGFAERPPLVIHAPGGMGKSALIARFILDHVDRGGPPQTTPTSFIPQVASWLERAVGPTRGGPLPFVYLDVDRPSVVPERPLTLLLEAGRQLAAQFPAFGERWQDVQQRWLSEASQAGALRGVSSVAAPIGGFAELLGAVGLLSEPLLVVVDTFEEVQYRSADFVEELLRFLDALQRWVPRVRTVISGRVPVQSDGFKVTNQALSPLGTDERVAFLAYSGVDDPATARAVAEQVGGSPLSLRLAVQVLRQQDEQPDRGDRGTRPSREIENFPARDRLFRRLSDAQVQGQLYRRILDHVRDDDVRRLAHPGLALRRITPEIIHDVLAGPCGVEVASLNSAVDLFDRMRQEAALVTTAADGSLRHLPEVRKVMLGLLREDEPVRAREIERRAVAYYRSRSAPAERAELLYHLLSLGHPRVELDAVWAPDLARYLADAADELPPRGRAYLSARIGGPSSADTSSREAELEDWEIATDRRVRNFLSLAEPTRALAALEERSERTVGSPLHLREAQARVLAGDWDRARSAVARGLSERAHLQEPVNALKLRVVEAWIDRHLGEPSLGMPGVAGDRPDEFTRLHARFGGDPRTLRFGLHRLAVVGSGWASVDLAKRVADAFTATSDARLAEYRLLCCDLAGAIGAVHPDVLWRVLRSVGLPRSAESSTLERLRPAVNAWIEASDAPESSRIATEAAAGRLSATERDVGDRAGVLSRALIAATDAFDGQVPAAVNTALAVAYAGAGRAREDQQLYEEMEAEDRLFTPAA